VSVSGARLGHGAVGLSLALLLGLSLLLQTSRAAWQVADSTVGNTFTTGSWLAPDAPTPATATPGDGQAALSWATPPPTAAP
jgi:hypothetical protein